MPSRNVLKQDVAGGYYHIYNRGVDKRLIFLERKDYAVFLNLLKRYLSIEAHKDNKGVIYPHFYNQLELLSFCLMPNHLHLLIYQDEPGTMRKLMSGVFTSYSKYFNKTYKRRGPLFESRYKASLISDQIYLEHISRYIHLNPSEWRQYSYSSLPYFLGRLKAEWVRPAKVADLFDSKADYLKFMEDYEGHRQMLEQTKRELANY
ncbi:MAG TPA: transposase [Candidatus Nitrosopolaris sp.]|nr:transposase [Candidatus Nitrosopolaris sp.]